MAILVYQAVWCALAALALQFLGIWSRLRHDRACAFLGLSLLLMSGLFLPDAWFFPYQWTSEEPFFRFHIRHLFWAALLPALFQFISHACHPIRSNLFKAFIALDLAIAAWAAVALATGSDSLLYRLHRRADPTASGAPPHSPPPPTC